MFLEIVAALILLLLQFNSASAQQIDTLELRAHMRFLADDALHGRGTGTDGERIAALYIESQLRRLALKPPPAGYRQSVPLRRAQIDSSRLIVGAGRDSTVFSAQDFVLNTGAEPALRGFSGNAVFVGTAEHAREASESAFSGRVLIVLGTLGSDAQTLIPRWLRSGVRGVVLLIPDSAQFDLFARSRGEARYYIAAPIDEPIWQSALPVIIAGPLLSRALIGQIPDALSRLSRAGIFAPVALNRSVTTEVHTTTEVVNSTNVIGVIAGRDPRLSREYVIYTAHYDHLGISLPDSRGDSIYNGFSDNAAGVAMLLAIAQQLERQPPARSVAFIFFTAEEHGLLGSAYYASQPVLPLASTVAVINLDAGAPPAPPIEWRLAGGASNTIGETARTIAAARGWKLAVSEATPNSDYWAFHAQRVPAVFLIPGAQWEGVPPTQRDALRARWDRYHRADDEWHDDFPFRGLQRYAQFALALGQALAESPQRPRMR